MDTERYREEVDRSLRLGEEKKERLAAELNGRAAAPAEASLRGGGESRLERPYLPGSPKGQEERRRPAGWKWPAALAGAAVSFVLAAAVVLRLLPGASGSLPAGDAADARGEVAYEAASVRCGAVVYSVLEEETAAVLESGTNALYDAVPDAQSPAASRRLPTYRFETREELDFFRVEFDDVLGLSASWEPQNFVEASAGYDAAFFETNTLIAVYLCAGSGSDEYDVSGLTREGETLTVRIGQTNQPGLATQDLAGWLFLIAVDREDTAGCTAFDAFLDRGAAASAQTTSAPSSTDPPPATLPNDGGAVSFRSISDLSISDGSGSLSVTVVPSEEDAAAFRSLLLDKAWAASGVPLCLQDFEVRIGSTVCLYHSDCGAFFNEEEQISLTLTEEERKAVNAVLLRYFQDWAESTTERTVTTAPEPEAELHSTSAVTGTVTSAPATTTAPVPTIGLPPEGWTAAPGPRETITTAP